MTSSNTRIRAAILAIFIVSTSCSVSAVPVLSDISFQPSMENDQPIQITVKVTDSVNVTGVQIYYEREDYAFPEIIDMNLTSGTPDNGTWSGTIPPQEWGGTLTFRIVAENGLTVAPSQGSYSIEIDGPESPFPWKWVVIGAFLVFVFIATELAFKPGLWRPTGRERAQALEEEDRRKEEEEKEKENQM